MSDDDSLANALQMLLSMCDRLKAEMTHGPIAWDERKPTMFYLIRNMEFARQELAKLNDRVDG